MKLLSFLLLLPLTLFAGNMSLGPYNDEKFKTLQEQEQKQKAIQEKEALKNRKQLENFEKRQTELKQQRYEAKKERLRIAKAKEEEKQRLIREEEVRQKIAKNLQLKKEEELHKHTLEQKRLKQEKISLLEQKALLANQDTNLSLTAEQADLSMNNPDDIDTELANINRLRDILLYSNSTPEFIKDYIRLLLNLEKNYNIDLAFAYRAIAQGELDSGTYAGGGKYDITMRYRASETTHFAFRIDGRHQVGQYSSTEFKNEFGALSSTSASYRKEDPFFSQVWVQHKIGNFSFRTGKIDPSSFIDSHLFKSNSRFFFNSNFSTSPYNSYPGNGLGFVGRYQTDEYYFTAEISDANALSDELNDDFFTDKDYYSAIELGRTPKDGSKYHLTAWHRDATKQGRDEAKGLIASVVEALNTDTHIILRAAYSDNALAKRYASVGIGKFSLFKEHDISGLALGLLKAKNSNTTPSRTQTTLESFYRIDPLPGVQISADLQLMYHPSLSEQTWAILPGLRLRVLF